MRKVPSTHGSKPITADADYEVALTRALLEKHSRTELETLYREYSLGSSFLDVLLRKALLRALAKNFGQSITISPNVAFRHPETMEIGDGVFFGEGAIIQGRFDGTCRIGKGTWIGPQSFLDARSLTLGEYVGWGPGAKILGSEHTGFPVEVPIIQTELEILPVTVEDWADIGVNAVLLPGVKIGKGSIVGAGAIVTKDVAPWTKVAGVPARVIGERRPSSIPPALEPQLQ